MLVKEKSYRKILKKKIFFLSKTFIFFLFFVNISHANLKKNLIDSLSSTNTLTFNFKQIIGQKKEEGICFIKYPLLMKCNYKIPKQKVLISNGKTIAIIKKKYKKIYFYPLKSTPLFTLLKKEKIINLIKSNEPVKVDSDLIGFIFVDKKFNKLKIIFDKKKLQLKGWETEDAYSNNVSFIIDNVKINSQIVDSFFKIPREEDL